VPEQPNPHCEQRDQQRHLQPRWSQPQHASNSTSPRCRSAFESKGKYNQERFAALLNAIGDWNLFLAFNIIDGCTAGKSREPLWWLFREVAGKVESTFTEADYIAKD
jgi:hypothetical protein